MKNNQKCLWGPGLIPAAVSPSGGGISNPFDVRILFADNGGRTVRTQRRRRTSEPSGERERAQAPQRRRPSSQQPPQPPSGGAGGGTPPRPAGGMPNLGGAMGKSPLLLIVLAILFAIFVLPNMGGEDLVPPGTGDGGAVVDYPTSTPAPVRPTNTPKPFVPPAGTSKEGQTWLVMLYQDADDKILEQDIYVDLNEAERVGSTDRVHIVTQVDRYQAGYQGDGDWSSAKRFYVTQDSDLGRLGSEQVADLGEVNMSDGQTLVDFVTWAVDAYPADKYVLILSDHGMGWPGGWSDADSKRRGEAGIPLASRLGDELYLHEIDAALGEIRRQTGIDKFELVGMDACLMGHLEVFSALQPHARYAVASQETEPALGWAYTSFLSDLIRNPDVDGAELGRLVVGSYVRDDQRIVDDQARAEMLNRGSPMGGLFGLLGGPTAEQVAQQMAQNVTLAAVDLSALPALMDSVNALAFSLQNARQPEVARARSYAQSFTSVFGKQVPPSYIDLGHFAKVLQRETRDGGITQAADDVLAALDRAVIAEMHGPNKPGATGVSIYFPNSQLYGSPVTGPQSYTAVARRFSDDSLWDDFLAFHYTGRTFEAAARTVVVPDEGTAVRGPGAGGIEVSPITLSDEVAAPGRPVLLSTDITGDNVGYVYLFVGFYDTAANSIFIADMDYLEGIDTYEVDGVYYPDWGEGAFTMEFEWEPLMFAIDDGVNYVVTALQPERYGAAWEDAVYSVDGIYTFAEGGEARYARLYFRDGYLRQVFGFTGEDGTGAPREIMPQPGDQFTVLEQWMDLDENGSAVEDVTQEGGTLTFGDQMFRWRELDAAPGAYIVGFIVEDVDGETVEVYTQVTVE